MLKVAKLLSCTALNEKRRWQAVGHEKRGNQSQSLPPLSTGIIHCWRAALSRFTFSRKAGEKDVLQWRRSSFQPEISSDTRSWETKGQGGGVRSHYWVLSSVLILVWLHTCMLDSLLMCFALNNFCFCILENVNWDKANKKHKFFSENIIHLYSELKNLNKQKTHNRLS